MKYILIIIITASPLVDNHNVSTAVAYFDTREACEVASSQIRSQEKVIGTYKYSAGCFKADDK